MTEMTFPETEDFDPTAGFVAHAEAGDEADIAYSETLEGSTAHDLASLPDEAPQDVVEATEHETPEGFATVWDGVELVLRQMVGALEGLRGDLQGLSHQVEARVAVPVVPQGSDKPMSDLVIGLKAHNREMIDRLELHIVKLFGRVNADALDLRGQMNRIERSLAQLAAAQKPSYLHTETTPEWAQKLLAKYEEMEGNIRRFDTEQIDDLKLRVEMMDRKLNDIIHGRPALASDAGGTSTSHELKLLLAEVIALQQRGDAIGARMAG